MTAQPVVELPVSRWAFRALIVFTIINIGAPQAFIPALEPFRLALLAAGVAAAAYAAEQWSGAVNLGPRARELKLIAALVMWSLVTVPFSMWPGGSVTVFTDQFIKSIITCWLLARVLRRTDHMRVMFVTLTALSLPLALTGIIEFHSGDMERGRIMGYASGVAANPNDLAMMLDLMLPITVVVALRARTTLVRLGASAMILANLACLTLTFSRAGFLGFAAIVFAAGVTVARRGRWVAIVTALVVLCSGALLLPSSYVDRLSSIGDIDADTTGSAQARWAGMIAAVESIQSRPLVGAGLGQDILALVGAQKNKADWLHVHNTYLEVAVDLGLPGLLLFVALLYCAYRTVARVERESLAEGLEELSMMATALRLSLVGLIVTAFFAPVPYNFPFYYVLGLIVALNVSHASSRTIPSTAPAR